MSGNTLQECSFLDLFFGDGTEGETVITRTTETKGVDSGLGVGDVVIVPLPWNYDSPHGMWFWRFRLQIRKGIKVSHQSYRYEPGQ